MVRLFAGHTLVTLEWTMASIRKHRGKWQVQVRRKGLPLISKTFTAREDALRWSRETERRVDTVEISFTPVCDEPLRFLSEILDRYERQVSVGLPPQK